MLQHCAACSLSAASLLWSLPNASPPRLRFASLLQAASAPQLFQIQKIAAALVGFLCYKAAVVGVAIIPPPTDDERSLLAQADAGGNGGNGSHD